MRNRTMMRWSQLGLLMGAWLLCGQLLAQEQPLADRDKANIKSVASRQLQHLNDLLNQLASEALEDNDADVLIKNSYQPHPDQVFLNESVIVEDDINPTHTSADKTEDSPVAKYLNDLYLFYAKTSIEKPIVFSKQQLSDIVQQPGQSIYIKIFFTSFFKNRHKTIKEEYKPTERVVEMRVTKVNNKWAVYITRFGFMQPGEGIQQVVKKKAVVQVAFAKPPVPDNLVVPGPEVIYQQPDDHYTATLKFNKSWLQVVQTGSAELPVGFYARMGNAYAFDSLNNITFENNNRRFIFHKGLGFKAFDRVVPEKAAPPAPPKATKEDSLRAAQILANRAKPAKPVVDTTDRLVAKKKPKLETKPKSAAPETEVAPAKLPPVQKSRLDTSQVVAFQPPSAVTPNRPEVTPESVYKVPEKEPKKTKEKPAKKEKEKSIVAVPEPKKVGPDLANGLSADARKQKAHYRTAGWLQLVAGVAGIAGSYVAYSSIQKDYTDYSAKLTTLNAQYDIWKDLARQPTGARNEPLSLTGYGSPGIYGAYGGGAISLGLVVNGVRSLLKAGKVKPKATAAK